MSPSPSPAHGQAPTPFSGLMQKAAERRGRPGGEVGACGRLANPALSSVSPLSWSPPPLSRPPWRSGYHYRCHIRTKTNLSRQTTSHM